MRIKITNSCALSFILLILFINSFSFETDQIDLAFRFFYTNLFEPVFGLLCDHPPFIFTFPKSLLQKVQSCKSCINRFKVSNDFVAIIVLFDLVSPFEVETSDLKHEVLKLFYTFSRCSPKTLCVLKWNQFVKGRSCWHISFYSTSIKSFWSFDDFQKEVVQDITEDRIIIDKIWLWWVVINRINNTFVF